MVGIDLVSAARIENAAKSTNFLKKTLLATEQEYLNNKSTSKGKNKFSPYIMSLAGFFAAKEAVLKAAGVGITNGFGFLDVEIKHENSGAIFVKLSPRLQQHIKAVGKIEISISHDGEYAVAIALIS